MFTLRGFGFGLPLIACCILHIIRIGPAILLSVLGIEGHGPSHVIEFGELWVDCPEVERVGVLLQNLLKFLLLGKFLFGQFPVVFFLLLMIVFVFKDISFLVFESHDFPSDFEVIIFECGESGRGEVGRAGSEGDQREKQQTARAPVLGQCFHLKIIPN